MDRLDDRQLKHRQARTQIAACKYTCAKVLREVSYRALHIMGSLGTTDLTPLQAMWAAAPTMAIADGVDEVHKVTVARNVLKGYQPHPGLWPTEYLPAKREEARKKYADLIAADPDLAAWADAAAAPATAGADMEVNGKVAVVTGGASGIGRALSLAFAEHGAAGVVVVRHRTAAVRRPWRRTSPGRPAAIAVTADVASEPDVQALVSQRRGGVRADRPVLLQRRDHRGGRHRGAGRGMVTDLGDQRAEPRVRRAGRAARHAGRGEAAT